MFQGAWDISPTRILLGSCFNSVVVVWSVWLKGSVLLKYSGPLVSWGGGHQFYDRPVDTKIHRCWNLGWGQVVSKLWNSFESALSKSSTLSTVSGWLAAHITYGGSRLTSCWCMNQLALEWLVDKAFAGLFQKWALLNISCQSGVYKALLPFNFPRLGHNSCPQRGSYSCCISNKNSEGMVIFLAKRFLTLPYKSWPLPLIKFEFCLLSRKFLKSLVWKQPQDLLLVIGTGVSAAVAPGIPALCSWRSCIAAVIEAADQLEVLHPGDVAEFRKKVAKDGDRDLLVVAHDLIRKMSPVSHAIPTWSVRIQYDQTPRI